MTEQCRCGAQILRLLTTGNVRACFDAEQQLGGAWRRDASDRMRRRGSGPVGYRLHKCPLPEEERSEAAEIIDLFA